MQIQLKACPFCDSKSLRPDPHGYMVIVCNDCGAQGPSGLIPTELRAARWNNRPREEELERQIDECESAYQRLQDDY